MNPQPALEVGMKHLAEGNWLPPPVDPSWVISSVRDMAFEACVGRLHQGAMLDTNVVERLAIAHGLYYRSEAGRAPPILMDTLEGLGFTVSASFAEVGADSYALMETIVELETGVDVGMLRRVQAYEALGRLWSAAFNAPAGYAHYIARSAYGAEPAGTGFFRAVADTRGMAAPEEAKYLKRMLDMLQAGVEVKELPEATVGATVALPTWRAPSWAVYLSQPNNKRWRLEVHVKQLVLGSGTTRFTVKLVEAVNQVTVASIRAVVMEGDSGSYDDFLTQSAIAGAACERTVDAVFAPSESVGIYPRVRWLLEAAGDRLFKLAVVEGMYADPTWRHRGIGNLLMEQLLVETDMVDVMIGHPAALESDAAESPMSLGVQAGFAVARLALGRYFAKMGAEYLVGGVMGLRVSALRRLHHAGTESRLG